MGKAFIVISLLVVGVTGVGLPPPASADAEAGSYVTPASKAAGLENCVRETGFMRRNHMELITHQRDATVHQGIRSTTDSLAACVECHVSYDQQQQPVSVYSSGQFCSACHEFTAVDVNCFGCHATVPLSPEAASDAGASPPAAENSAPWRHGIEVADVPSEAEQGVGE